MGPLAEDAWDLYIVLLLSKFVGEKVKIGRTKTLTILETGEEIESSAGKSSSSKTVKTSIITEKNRME